jgi:drug/metabolite transporter (DMT)-like permease
MLSYQFLLNAGERTVAAGTAALLVQMVPIFTALLAWLLLVQRPARGTWLGMGLGFLGAVIIVVGQHPDLRVGVDTLFVLGAAVSQAAFFVLQKPLLDRYSGFEATCYATWTGCLFALPFVPWAAADLTGVSADGILSVVFLGLGPSAIGYATWAYAMARTNVSVAANTLYLVPPIAVAIGWIALREIPAPAVFVGGLIVIGGVAVTHRAPRARAPVPTHANSEDGGQH